MNTSSASRSRSGPGTVLVLGLGVCLLALGWWLRTAHLDSMSRLLHHDEAWYALNAVDLIEHPRFVTFFPENYGRESSWMYVLAGWMLILGEPVLDRFPGRVVNVHPALLPDGSDDQVQSSCGPIPVLRGAHAVRDALQQGLPVTGATVHVVTPVVDTGPVLLREEVPILAGDDQERLHARIKQVEHELLPRAVGLALANQEAKESTWRP